MEGESFMDLKKIIDKKDAAAQYMIDEITHICTKFEKRGPGDIGEKQACEYCAEEMKKLGFVIKDGKFVKNE